jgi:C4-dicarboxylate-specific signal transduction histidine kinase
LSYNHPVYVVSFSDSGSGISEENISRLFEPYFTMKRNGLGLASTLNILLANKGTIDVKNRSWAWHYVYAYFQQSMSSILANANALG